jgi:hypothetical protein
LGLNLLVTAIILWNTRYPERAVAALHQTEDVPDQLLAHRFPLGWEHVNLTGDYIWSAERPVTDSARSGLRPIPLARPPEFVVCRLCVKYGRFVTSGHNAWCIRAGERTNYRSGADRSDLSESSCRIMVPRSCVTEAAVAAQA